MVVVVVVSDDTNGDDDDDNGNDVDGDNISRMEEFTKEAAVVEISFPIIVEVFNNDDDDDDNNGDDDENAMVELVTCSPDDLVTNMANNDINDKCTIFKSQFLIFNDRTV